ncbi:hypothetical protein D3C78_1705470 [compost metagenome]
MPACYPVDARHVTLRSRVNQRFSESPGAADSRSIVGMLSEDGAVIGRSETDQQHRPPPGAIDVHPNVGGTIRQA